MHEMYLISEHQQILQTENEYANGRQTERYVSQYKYILSVHLARLLTVQYYPFNSIVRIVGFFKDVSWYNQCEHFAGMIKILTLETFFFFKLRVIHHALQEQTDNLMCGGFKCRPFVNEGMIINPGFTSLYLFLCP